MTSHDQSRFNSHNEAEYNTAALSQGNTGSNTSAYSDRRGPRDSETQNAFDRYFVSHSLDAFCVRISRIGAEQ